MNEAIKRIRVKVALLLLAPILGGAQGGNRAKISRKARPRGRGRGAWARTCYFYRNAIKRCENCLRRRYAGRSTPKHYVSDLSLFARLVGDKRPDQVSVQDVDRFVDQQVSQGLRSATINRRLAALHTFFEFLAAEEPDREWPNPVIWRRHGIKRGAHLPHNALDQDVERLFAAMNDARDRPIFGLMVGAGLRVGEVARARLQDLEAPSDPDQRASLPALWQACKAM